MRNPFFFYCIVAVFAACFAPQKSSAQKPASKSSNATDAGVPWKGKNLVGLETGSCHGYCPVYKLMFRSNGTLVYTGIRHVEKVGEEKLRITADEFGQLKAELSRADVWQYPEVIPSNVVDAPVYKLTVYDGNRKHTVKTTADVPKPLQALHERMKNIAEAHGIMVKKGVDPNDPANMLGQVLVKFQPDVNAGNFCMQFMEMKVRPVRRISEDNVWIIGFNPSELTETQFIDIIKEMDGVIEVQSNKAIKDRN